MDEPHSTPNGKKVLCIEDELFISDLYSRALSKAGYEIVVELDGIKGLELAQTNQFDIILLDLMIPRLTGTEILAVLRDQTKTPELNAKVIITTNLEQRDDIKAAVEQQADGYIVKANVTPRELVEFLSTIE